ncbi:nimrod B1 [Musca autumnalis]|uniref:nimrod B1 n=1 Tax=Musca autumnalis TaxID=221902 RepID=UPI003CF26F33
MKIYKSFEIIFIFLIDLSILNKFPNAQEIYGDIYPSTRAELNRYFGNQLREEKCYKDVPAIFFQTKENEPVPSNSSIPGHLRLEICCDGYRKNPKADGNLKCIPDCSKVSPDNCRHGFCRSPQQCECFEGFTKNSGGNCVHICPVGCENGRCLLSGVCLCNPGYILDPETRKYCIPECGHVPCGTNQICVAPGECRCRKGYEWLQALGCQPMCQPHCGYGRCIAPRECECFPGYIKRKGREICESECYANCANGFCESPYKCQCHIGFAYDPRSQNCLPFCGDSCEHGVCIAPGICKCFEGYYLWENTCRPICESGCGIYGQCIAPNKCACGQGQQLCLAGGNCTPNGKCQCPQGMNHFIDRCIYSATVENVIFTLDERQHFDKELRHEFEAIIGRMFQF